MISYLRGEVFEVTDNTVTLLVNGVGYDITVPSSSTAMLENGKNAAFYIIESLSQYDGTSLYGFSNKEDKQLFLLFKENIPNTGPKKAMELLNKALRSVADFHRAITQKDPKILTAIFGFTSKTADKLINSLKDKIDAVSIQGEAKIKALNDIPFISEIQPALAALGYSPAEVRRAIEKLYSEGKTGNTVEETVKAALRILKK